VRVIAGTHRGRPLRAPPGAATRPTSDRVREALFSILAPFDDQRVLDLFAGSGALGIEALSRGAGEAVFVDRSSAAVRAVRANLAALGLDGQVRRQDALAFLRKAPEEGRSYDLVFLDPPYREADGLAGRIGAVLEPVLAPGARIASESDRRSPIALDLPLELERRYGDTLIRIHSRP
jgi:16S rRNA (guanine966-N2)-methyltransferase